MPRRALLLLLALLLPPLGCGESTLDAINAVPVRVSTVVLDQRNAPVVILKEEGGPRVLPIWIGTAEATSIASEINQQRPPRPNFHDLAKRVIQTLEGEVLRVVVTELRNGTYYAVLSLRANGRVVEIDVRPSDGIAVALRLNAPILVSDSLLDDVGEIHEDGESRRSIRWKHAPPPEGTFQATSSLKL